MTQIKSRLKAAYENVEFYASNTWVHSSHDYQKANQDLYVREIKVRDALADEPTRPRTVRDSIPQSKLAKYSNYEYNESRELCYASGASNVSFYYPCVCKRSSIKEPWMLPEVEQLYIWFSYAPSFNISDFLQLEDLGHLDEQERLNSEENSISTWNDFHEVSPIFYEILERTPGKSRYTCSPPISESDLAKYIPSQLKIQTFEDMILRLKIKSVVVDKVRYLWSDHSRLRSETSVKEENDGKMNILKSPLGNYFLIEEPKENSNTNSQMQKSHKKNLATDDHQTKTKDFGQLQNLADSIRTLETFIYNSTRDAPVPSFSTNALNSYEIPEATPKTEAAPTRRLYSAVLQGLTTDKKQSSCTDVIGPSDCSAKCHSPFFIPSTLKTTLSSSFSTENSSMTTLTSLQKPLSTISKNITPCVEQTTQWTTQPSYWSTSSNTTQIKNYTQPNQEQIKSTCMPHNLTLLKSPPSQKFETPNVPFKISTLPSNTTITTSYSDACSTSTVNASTHNVSCAPPNNVTNMPSYSIPNNTYLGSTHTTNNVCFSNNNVYSNSYFNNNNTYQFHSQYPSNFQNNPYTPTSFPNNIYNNNTFQTNQMSVNSRNVFPQFNRQPYPSTQSHISSPHSMWFVQQNRPSSTLYSVAHFATQPYLLLPPPPPPPPPPSTLPPRQNQRWTPPTHYIRPSSTLQSFHVPLTSQHTTSSFTPQHWGMQNQNLYRASSNQQISSSTQQHSENQSNQSVRTKPKSKKSIPTSQINFIQHTGRRSRSPDGSTLSNDNLDNTEILSGTFSNTSMSYSKRSTASSDVTFSFTHSEKPLTVKSAASISSLDYKRTKARSDYKEIHPARIEKKCSIVILGNNNHNESASNYLSSDSEGSHTLLPIAATVSEELERQAIEQYQPSDDNFYQELERQAEEQYDEDHSENWKSPPNMNLFFGGHTIHSFNKNYGLLFFALYLIN